MSSAAGAEASGGAGSAAEQHDAAVAAVAATATDNIRAAEKATAGISKKLTTHALPIRQYLESTVVPVLMQGLQSLCKERPEDPLDYLAHYLLQHNPKAAGEAQQQQTRAQQPGAPSGGAEAG